jgi:hypothetical protein
MGKIETSMSAIEAVAPKLGDRVDIGTISFACAFGYLDLRFPDFGWRDRHPEIGRLVRALRRTALDGGDAAPRHHLAPAFDRSSKRYRLSAT